MNGLILTGGVWPQNPALILQLAQRAEYSICCDGAAALARKYDLPVSVLVGDFDSIQQEDLLYYTEEKHVPAIQLPVRKDITDTEFAIQHALEQGCTSLTFLGGLGKRLDHTMGQVQLLYALATQTIAHQVYADNLLAQAITGEHRYLVAKGQIFSLIPLTERCNVSIDGAAYPLDHHPLSLGTTLGISNEACADQITLYIHQGFALFLLHLDPSLS